MSYSIFCQTKNNVLLEPMFFGQPVNVSRYDQQKHPIFEQLIEKQLSFFWRPEEIDVSKDRIDFAELSTHEQHIFLSNLKYQTLLDSIQGRSPNVVLLPLVSIPELETWIETWSFSETIHSRSYTHIIRNVVNDPSKIFEDIVDNEYILERASDIAKYYDDLHLCAKLYDLHGEGIYQIDGQSVEVTLPKLKKQLYLCIVAVNVLEAIRFYVSFACSFAFAERKVMEGNAKIIKMIARDEALHLNGTQHMINLMRQGRDDPDMVAIAEACQEEAIEIFKSAAEQEKAWANYLFKDGSMIGLNRDILCQYIEFITNTRMSAIGLPAIFETKTNPIPWINAWLSSDNVQVAPQETEITTYLVGQIDSDLDDVDLDDFEL
ncbi:ribonucleotide-diphosphate reductase subunit beta [Moraxella catarrhalis]|uniref:class Ia ribonucleoside-diphosphate reductase subunit beta n=1 Tax=Moraxella TaxID=475 RepID=UPI000202A6C8|nr:MULTISPECIES: class Ia ribonucleoside-diphosphate reductase subunit beta [Moraxella]ARE65924.1 ribonucleotide-diphosphate reductase subunit beta [Moraxella catarrhalis]AXT96588.1 ribonucleotide-diphosphate reductase subunit beta [Moraxella catarrhalis]AZQ88401.1 ribonucleotide reductase, small chain family protein [Moraxella catarrhalis]EGE10501.1 ribonucleotide-diphosphate reductase subunit beta [Moraxella catarrhalis 46P47B1]EGE14410.1 ribonucleotide-diphosphate reductase subunit beta [Mo